MTMPDWRDEKLGTMKRAALWLVQEVGEGNSFTKSQLRNAFPGVAQIDRRMRDLRDFGWRIDTNREDVGLDLNEQRFSRQGTPVWEPGKATREATTVTAQQRREILARDGYMCRSCGIGPGEKYAGTERTAQLDVARRQVVLPDGRRQVQLVTECNRCRTGGREVVAHPDKVLSRAASLSALEKKVLASWMEQEARSISEVERIWADYLTLPADARELVRRALA